MDTLQFCRQEYQRYICMANLNDDLKRSLKSHERVPVFIDNLAKEINLLPHKISKQIIIGMIHDLTNIFIKAVEQKFNERVMSAAEIGRQKANQTKLNEMQALADKMSGDDYEQVTKSEKGETIRSSVKV